MSFIQNSYVQRFHKHGETKHNSTNKQFICLYFLYSGLHRSVRDSTSKTLPIYLPRYGPVFHICSQKLQASPIEKSEVPTIATSATSKHAYLP